MRRLLKSMVETVACKTGVTGWYRRRRADDVLILAYHNIVPDGERAMGDASLHLPQRAFAGQLDRLARTHDVVPLSAVFAPRTGTASKPRVVITFDDACQGAVSAGAAELALRGMPATIFVAPAFLGGRSFWWDALRQRDGAAIAERVRQYALHALQGKDARIRAWAVEQGFRVDNVPPHQCAATEEQLQSLPAGLFTLGSHSWSHPNLVAITPDELTAELTRSLGWLRERFRAAVPWLAYPYGQANENVAAAARSAGYDGALCIDGGWIGRSPRDIDVSMLPRQNIPSGLSLAGFELKTSGVELR